MALRSGTLLLIRLRHQRCPRSLRAHPRPHEPRGGAPLPQPHVLDPPTPPRPHEELATRLFCRQHGAGRQQLDRRLCRGVSPPQRLRHHAVAALCPLPDRTARRGDQLRLRCTKIARNGAEDSNGPAPLRAHKSPASPRAVYHRLRRLVQGTRSEVTRTGLRSGILPPPQLHRLRHPRGRKLDHQLPAPPYRRGDARQRLPPWPRLHHDQQVCQLRRPSQWPPSRQRRRDDQHLPPVRDHPRTAQTGQRHECLQRHHPFRMARLQLLASAGGLPRLGAIRQLPQRAEHLVALLPPAQ